MNGIWCQRFVLFLRRFLYSIFHLPRITTSKFSSNKRSKTPCQDRVLRPIERHRSILTSRAGGTSSTADIRGSKGHAYQLQQYQNAPARSDPWTPCGVDAKPNRQV